MYSRDNATIYELINTSFPAAHNDLSQSTAEDYCLAIAFALHPVL